MKKVEKKEMQEVMENGSKFIKEFKKFISRGNAIDLAVGVIVGGAFSKIITSIVEDILMPLLGIALGGHDFKGLSLNIGNATVKYGSFIQNIIDFLIVSFCIFMFVKLINKFTKKEEKKEEKKVEENILLLQEIRDLLKEAKK